MSDYSDLGLNPQLLSTNSILNNNSGFVNAYQFESSYEIQTRRLNSSRVSLGTGFIQTSGVSSGTFALTSGTNAVLTSTMTWASPKTGQPAFGIPFFSWFQGAVMDTAHQIWPNVGTAVTRDRYRCSGAYNLAPYNGSNTSYSSMITDTNGTSGSVLTYAIEWQFLDYNASTLQ